MKYEILILKLAILLTTAMTLAILILVIPDEISIADINTFLVSIYISAIPFLLALFQTFKLLNYINTEKGFSKESIKALGVIKYCGFSFSLLFLIQLPFLFNWAQSDDAPGLAGIGLIFTFVPFVIAIFVSLLQRVIKGKMKD